MTKQLQRCDDTPSCLPAANVDRKYACLHKEIIEQCTHQNERFMQLLLTENTWNISQSENSMSLSCVKESG